MADLKIDESQWPVVVYSVRGDVDIECVKQVTDTFKRLCERHERFINVFDLRDMGSMPASSRRTFTEDAQANAALYSKYVITAICIVPSRIARGVLTAMQWVFSFPHPVEPVPDHLAAIATARERAAKAGLSAPTLAFEPRRAN